MSKYSFNEEQYFVIDQYDQAKTFSSFLPGLAGLFGIPIWSFYVNRGQAMVSFGVQDKNHAITEFFPANQAYNRVSVNGFRTFVKLRKEDCVEIFEPFSSYGNPSNHSRKMYIKENELKIQETNVKNGIETLVTYFTLPNENFGALVRKVEFKNISEQKINIEVLDGLPAIIPFGIDDAAYKAVGNTLKSWMDVFNLENRIPYYRVRSSTNDSAEVEEVTKGHFYFSFINDGELLSPIVDADLIFGSNSSLSYPNEFDRKTVSELLSTTPVTSNKVPCGFSGFSKELEPGEVACLYTMIGHVNDIEIINEKASSLSSADYIEMKYVEAKTLVSDITKDVFTKTSEPLLDAYINQSYLDNILRGGYPILLETNSHPFVYYVFSRKHGDLERDYNFFSLAPEFFSQGNGNFRDVNQNRRNDVFFHPEVGDYNIKLFMSLVQADGYNPLVVKGASFELKNKDNLEWLDGLFESDRNASYIKKKLAGSFTPGDLLQTIVDKKINMTVSLQEFLKAVLSKSIQNAEAEFGEGYWMDHWTYNLDLIENFLKIYPDKKEELLFADSSYKYFSSPAFVNARSEKYVLSDGIVRQYAALKEVESHGGNWLKTNKGEVYHTDLFSKLFTLALIKFATLDPHGMGIEMEANKPGWNDSMNGLPGLFGSSMGESLELKRLLEFVIEACTEKHHSIKLPLEVCQLTSKVKLALGKYKLGEYDDFAYWDEVTTAREGYRVSVLTGFDGEEETVALTSICELANEFLEKVNKGISKAISLGEGLIPTYFYFEASSFQRLMDEDGVEKLSEKGLPLVKVTSFSVKVLPHFLEGPARAIKSVSVEDARNIYQKVRTSDIFDQKLKMYKTSCSLEEQTFEIGRARAFTPGWLERESVFMHMEFKYLLSLIKAGLYEEFFDDLKHALPPFMDAQVYGRSVLENSSFIASSVNPDPQVHGQGFVARLSGTTAEFLSIWQWMMMGKEVFSFKKGMLSLSLKPILPAWLFDDRGQVQFSFLGKTRVTYHNPKKKNTFGQESVKPIKYILFTGKNQVEISGDRLNESYALQVRNGEIERIDVYLN